MFVQVFPQHLRENPNELLGKPNILIRFLYIDIDTYSDIKYAYPGVYMYILCLPFRFKISISPFLNSLRKYVRY